MKNITICPKCGYKRTEDDNEYVSLEECPSCGIIYKKIKQIPPQQVDESINIEDRGLCGDGCCIGIIGKNGLCTECGKSLEETSSHSVNIEEKNECKEKLVNCEVCEKQVSINAISCPHCGEPKKQKEQNTPASFNPPTSDKENKNKLSPGCLIALAIFALFAVFSQNDNNSNTSTSSNTATNQEQSSCYGLGYKFGRCAAQVMINESCSPSDDIVIPSRCRGKDETQNGITAGAKSVYQRHK